MSRTTAVLGAQWRSCVSAWSEAAHDGRATEMAVKRDRGDAVEESRASTLRADGQTPLPGCVSGDRHAETTAANPARTASLPARRGQPTAARHGDALARGAAAGLFEPEGAESWRSTACPWRPAR